MNLAELMVSLSLAALLALGAGATLLRSVNQGKTYSDEFQTKTLALTASRALTGYAASSSSTALNCAGRVSIIASNYATFFNAASATDGTGFQLTLNKTAMSDSDSLVVGQNSNGTAAGGSN